MSDLLKLTNVTVQYKLEDRVLTAMDGISLVIPHSNYSVGVIGESGSGKTTLGMSIMNAIPAPGKIVDGDIQYDGQDVLKMNDTQLRRYRWEKVSMVYQSAMNSLNPVKKSVDHLIEVILEHQKVSKREARDRSIRLLSSMGLKSELMDGYAHELSGGMRQRVVIAMALTLLPRILIADEPTSALDVVTQKQILTLLSREISRNDLSLIFITHEISLLNGLVEYVVVMYAGEIFERGPLSKVLSEPLHPYTETLLGTVLTFNSNLSMVTSASTQRELGQLPSANFCMYASRCKYVFERCLKEKPRLREVGTDRWAACHKYN
ncbi:MAG: ABC transporter ATP-binding protein [Thaumarchaeota archaeon]|nr:ABC transporter ATP-binding protein [Nitrososphaerota archaeon]